MIDRQNKRVLNGYGSISVGASLFSALILTHIEPPKTVGEAIADLDELTVHDEIKLTLTLEEVIQLIEDLERVGDENPIVYADGWELNFEHFDPRSVAVYVKQCQRLMSSLMLPLAC